MLSRFVLGFATVCFTVSAWAAKEIVFFGGGGEPQGPTTIFDAAYANFAPFKPDSGWSVRSYFDGGHSTSQAIADQMFPGKNKSMTTKNVSQEIANLKARIQRGELKSGDQVMITLATHGLKKSASQSTHNVATVDGSFNVDELKQLRDLAEKKGVSLAIVDFSCYSGNSLNLGTDKTCVISAAGDSLAYNTTGHSMSTQFKKGVTLEEAFLKGRQVVNPAAPQISSEAGRKAYELTKVLTESMKERSAIATAQDTGANCYGTSSSPYRKLSGQLKDIQRSMGMVDYLKVQLGLAENKIKPMIDKLDAAVKKYANSRTQVQKTFDELKALDKEQCYEMGIKMCGNFDNWTYGHKVLKDLQTKRALSAAEKTELALYEGVLKRPEYQRWSALKKKFDTHNSLWDEANDVAAAERDIYKLLYDHFSKQSTKPNPCRSFVL